MKKGTLEWYADAWEKMEFDSGFAGSISKAAQRVLAGKDAYVTVEKRTSVPWYVIGAIHYKEATCDFKACLHNGERIIGTGKKTTIVPIGKGPFATWEEAAIDALLHDGLNKNSDWSIANILKLLEEYNGTGVLRYHQNENTAYLWAQTSLNDGTGKYVSDGKWDENAPTNKTTGAAAILKQLELIGEISFSNYKNPLPSAIASLQTAINLFNYKLAVDGIAGPKTKFALNDLAQKL